MSKLGGLEGGSSRRERGITYGVGIAVFTVQVDWFAVNVTLPSMGEAFSVPVTDLQWVLSGFMVAFGAAVTIAGWLTDVIGDRATFLLGLAVFIASSVFCATATSPAWLSSGRVGQGLGGGLIVPAAIALVSRRVPEGRRAAGLGPVLGLAGAGGAIGPAFGGALTTAVGWRLVFWVNVPVCLTAAAVVSALITPLPHSRIHNRFPAWGLILALSGVVSIMVAADRQSAWGWRWTAVMGSTGILLLGGFATVERYTRAPMFGIEVFGNGRLLRLSLAGASGTLSLGVLPLLIVASLHEHGTSSLGTGTAMLYVSVPDAIGAYAAGRGPVARHSNSVMVGALVLLAVSMTGLTFATAHNRLLLAVSGISMGLTTALSTFQVQHCVPPRRVGAAASLSLSLKMMLAGVGIAVSATWYEALARGGPNHPGPLPVEAVVLLPAALAAAGLAAISPLARERRRTHQV